MRNVSDFAAHLAMMNAAIVSELVQQSSGETCPVTCSDDRAFSHGVKTGQEVPTADHHNLSQRPGGELEYDEYDDDIADQLHIEITDGFITDDYYDG